MHGEYVLCYTSRQYEKCTIYLTGVRKNQNQKQQVIKNMVYATTGAGTWCFESRIEIFETTVHFEYELK